MFYPLCRQVPTIEFLRTACCPDPREPPPNLNFCKDTAGSRVRRWVFDSPCACCPPHAHTQSILIYSLCIQPCSLDLHRYGAFIPTDRAYFNVSTPRASGRRPSSEQLREYRRDNVTAGIDTHRSDVSFGKTTESIRGGVDGDPRAREATKSLTSGEVSYL